METIKLALKKRDPSASRAKDVRDERRVPGVIYGHAYENRSVSAPYAEFDKAYRKGGESTLVDLEIEGDEPVKALIKDVQRDHLTGAYTHVDFYKVNLTEKITAEIELNFVGESPAVKEAGGSLVKSLDTIEVECLPTDLVHTIDVDVSSLMTFDDVIRVKDLTLPKGIELLDDPEMTVATVEPPMTEEQMKALEQAGPADVSEIKTVAEEKKAAEEAEKSETEGEEKKE